MRISLLFSSLKLLSISQERFAKQDNFHLAAARRSQPDTRVYLHVPLLFSRMIMNFTVEQKTLSSGICTVPKEFEKPGPSANQSWQGENKVACRSLAALALHCG
jgi:hypothetical protein